jgi:hypothetical protein
LVEKDAVMADVITIEDIKKEVERVPVDKLEGLYHYVRSLADLRPRKQSRESFIERMNKIRIDGPPDLATNLDDYLYGDKNID